MIPRKMIAGMNVRWMIPLGLVVSVAVGGVTAAALRHSAAHTAAGRGDGRGIVGPAAARDQGHRGARLAPGRTSRAGRTSRVPLRRLTHTDPIAGQVAELVRLAGLRHAERTWARVLAAQAPPIPEPRAPLLVGQIGGQEPAMRLLPDGSWINSTGVAVALRVSGAVAGVRLQPQIELRPVSQPFTGHPTASGAIVIYRGSALTELVRLGGLRNGIAYHWRARVHDPRGANSPWVSPAKAGVSTRTGTPTRWFSRWDLRVSVVPPPAPSVTLVTAVGPDGWAGTRRLTLRWLAPSDRTGIRGYSYTLSRSPLARPLLHWRTGATKVTILARGDGRWYFTVRALNNAHTWGPPSWRVVRIDTAAPRLRVLAAPDGPVNPRRVHPLLRLALTRWSRVTVDVVAGGGRIVRSIRTHLHGSGYLAITWDGRGAHGARLPNGRYTLRISATSRAGVTWSTLRPLFLEAIPPSFRSFGLSQTGAYNPYNNALDGPESITTTLDHPAVVRIDAVQGDRVLRSWQLVALHAGQVITATWNGATALGAGMPEGLYTFRARAVDAAGNVATATLGSVALDLRRIVVALDAQQLWALDGNRVLLTTLVTTGGPILPTPTGDFQIIDRESPFTFRSMYPKGSILWYPPSPVTYALLFQQDGYYIHDAPWRGFFGPGSNAVDGTPGTNTTGTHGCVNVPYNYMAWLFSWATMYTPVQVRQHVTNGEW